MLSFSKKEGDNMTPFINKHHHNAIKKHTRDLHNAFRNCVDAQIIDATKMYLNQKILDLFPHATEEEKQLISILAIANQFQIEAYLSHLDEWVCGMPKVTSNQLKKLFRREKKLRLPKLSSDNKNVYFGWVDETARRLYIAYFLQDKLVGMACRISSSNSSNTRSCTLCNHVGKVHEVAFVSPICKNKQGQKGAYRSIGFNICLDSQGCNQRITNTEKLEKLLKNVNNLE